jgi:hypothetical protein
MIWTNNKITIISNKLHCEVVATQSVPSVGETVNLLQSPNILVYHEWITIHSSILYLLMKTK